MQATVRQLKVELAQEAVQLSQRRRAAAGSLRAAVEACLADLSMAGSRFDVRIGWEEHAKVSGVHTLQAWTAPRLPVLATRYHAHCHWQCSRADDHRSHDDLSVGPHRRWAKH